MSLSHCFNPHPTRRPDATNMALAASLAAPCVFQSSPDPKARDATPLCRSPRPGLPRFNPHPTRRPDATAVLRRQYVGPSPFQSSPDPKAGCDPGCGAPGWRAPWRFNPHPTRRPDATRQFPACSTSGQPTVSILTRPEGRMRRAGDSVLKRRDVHVSILTRPEGRMRRHSVGVWSAIGVSILTRPEGRMRPTHGRTGECTTGCFNPHPTRRPDATRTQYTAPDRPLEGFNPHPTRRPDATRPGAVHRVVRCHVSILTRPEGRMRPALALSIV